MGLTRGGAFGAMVCVCGFPEFLDLSARTREGWPGLTQSRVSSGAMANDYSGKLMFGAPCGSRVEMPPVAHA